MCHSISLPDPEGRYLRDDADEEGLSLLLPLQLLLPSKLRILVLESGSFQSSQPVGQSAGRK